MSRFSEGSEDSNFGYLWGAILERSVKSKRRRPQLEALHDALLAMEPKELIYGGLTDCKGGLCANGVLLKAIGRTDLIEQVEQQIQKDLAENEVAKARKWTAAYEEDWFPFDVGDTKETMKKAGIPWTIIWELGYTNDGATDPRARWWSVYRMVCGWLNREPDFKLRPVIITPP